MLKFKEKLSIFFSCTLVSAALTALIRSIVDKDWILTFIIINVFLINKYYTDLKKELLKKENSKKITNEIIDAAKKAVKEKGDKNNDK